MPTATGTPSVSSVRSGAFVAMVPSNISRLRSGGGSRSISSISLMSPPAKNCPGLPERTYTPFTSPAATMPCSSATAAFIAASYSRPIVLTLEPGWSNTSSTMPCAPLSRVM